MEKILYMMIGSTGTGKSFHSTKLSDDLKIEILSADSVEKRSKSGDDNEIELDIMQDYLDQLDSGKSFILDGSNINKPTRKLYMTIAKQRGFKIKGYDFGPGNDKSLSKRLKDPREVSEDRWRIVAERNKLTYEKPTLEEGFDEITDMQ
jgi:predicted kinase